MENSRRNKLDSSASHKRIDVSRTIRSGNEVTKPVKLSSKFLEKVRNVLPDESDPVTEAIKLDKQRAPSHFIDAFKSLKEVAISVAKVSRGLNSIQTKCLFDSKSLEESLREMSIKNLSEIRQECKEVLQKVDTLAKDSRFQEESVGEFAERQIYEMTRAIGWMDIAEKRIGLSPFSKANMISMQAYFDSHALVFEKLLQVTDLGKSKALLKELSEKINGSIEQQATKQFDQAKHELKEIHNLLASYNKDRNLFIHDSNQPLAKLTEILANTDALQKKIQAPELASVAGVLGAFADLKINEMKEAIEIINEVNNTEEADSATQTGIGIAEEAGSATQTGTEMKKDYQQAQDELVPDLKDFKETVENVEGFLNQICGAIQQRSIEQFDTADEDLRKVHNLLIKYDKDQEAFTQNPDQPLNTLTEMLQNAKALLAKDQTTARIKEMDEVIDAMTQANSIGDSSSAVQDTMNAMQKSYEKTQNDLVPLLKDPGKAAENIKEFLNLLEERSKLQNLVATIKSNRAEILDCCDWNNKFDWDKQVEIEDFKPEEIQKTISWMEKGLFEEPLAHDKNLVMNDLLQKVEEDLKSKKEELAPGKLLEKHKNKLDECESLLFQYVEGIEKELKKGVQLHRSSLQNHINEANLYAAKHTEGIEELPAPWKECINSMKNLVDEAHKLLEADQDAKGEGKSTAKLSERFQKLADRSASLAEKSKGLRDVLNRQKLQEILKDAKNFVDHANKIATVCESLPMSPKKEKYQKMFELEEIKKSIDETITCLQNVEETPDVLSQRLQQLDALMKTPKIKMEETKKMLDKLSSKAIGDIKSDYELLVKEYWYKAQDEINLVFSEEQVCKFDSFITNLSSNYINKDISKAKLLAEDYGNITEDKRKLREILKDIEQRFKDNRNIFEQKRREHIEDLLKQLPKQLPTLGELPEQYWWKLYIDAPLHHEALQQNPDDPGTLFDQDRSPGYQRSMTHLFEMVLATEQTSEQNITDYHDWYTQFHEYATKYLPFETQEKYRKQNGFVREGGELWPRYKLPLMPNNELELQERFAALKELREERVNDLPLLQNWPANVQQLRFYDSKAYPEIRKQLPKGITIAQTAQILANEPMWMMPLYAPSESKQHVHVILKSYFEGPKATDPYQKLKDIATTVRTIHVLHPKGDGNGRTNVYGLMNYLLKKEGFCPAILPNGPEVFGGTKTLDGLVEDMLLGMHEFIKVVKQHKL